MMDKLIFRRFYTAIRQPCGCQSILLIYLGIFAFAKIREKIMQKTANTTFQSRFIKKKYPASAGSRNSNRPSSDGSSSFDSRKKPSYFGGNSGSSSDGRGDRRSQGQSSSYGNSRPSSGGFRRSSGGGRNSRPKRSFGESIDISKFVKKSSDIQQKELTEITHKFSDFALCEPILQNLKHKKYETPTPIQDQAINHLLEGRDLIGLANTGTGKTAAFLLPLINKVWNDKSQKVLIIAPTRELAQQIEVEFRQFSWNMKLFSAICVGGAPVFKQIGNLKRNPHFVIGTPGRLKDLSERGLVDFTKFNNIVLDEVDRMLDMGFVDEIKEIVKQLPEDRQSLFFSATMPIKIRDLVTKILKDPITVEIKSGQTTENVDQDIVRVRDREMKFTQLSEILRQDDSKKVLIFIETKAEVEKLTRNLVTEGFKADSIHGDKKQHQRQRALTSFKRDDINILVATDVAARGLDINDISHVINYTVPQTYNDYIHRIGRTGRGMKKGSALTFVDAR